MSGTTASIPILWTNDRILKPDRILALDVVALPSDGYRTGGLSRHIIRLADDDGWWNGVCQDSYAQRNFRLKLARNAAGLEATFAAGPGNDGLPPLPVEQAGNLTSVSEGIVPLGTFACSIQADTPTHFKITSAAMPVPASGITGPVTDMKRTIVLEALVPPVRSPTPRPPMPSTASTPSGWWAPTRKA